MGWRNQVPVDEYAQMGDDDCESDSKSGWSAQAQACLFNEEEE